MTFAEFMTSQNRLPGINTVIRLQSIRLRQDPDRSLRSAGHVIDKCLRHGVVYITFHGNFEKNNSVLGLDVCGRTVFDKVDDILTAVWALRDNA